MLCLLASFLLFSAACYSGLERWHRNKGYNNNNYYNFWLLLLKEWKLRDINRWFADAAHSFFNLWNNPNYSYIMNPQLSNLSKKKGWFSKRQGRTATMNVSVKKSVFTGQTQHTQPSPSNQVLKLLFKNSNIWIKRRLVLGSDKQGLNQEKALHPESLQEHTSVCVLCVSETKRPHWHGGHVAATLTQTQIKVKADIQL